jgi:hypothetical protein
MVMIIHRIIAALIKSTNSVNTSPPFPNTNPGKAQLFKSSQDSKSCALPLIVAGL